MMFREIVGVYSETHMNPTSTLRGQNTELLNIKVERTARSVGHEL
jgi:hypothetical protein